MALLARDDYDRTLALLTLSFAGFAASFTGHLIASSLGTYMDSFGTSATAIGLVIGSLALAEVIFKTPFGILSDRYGRLSFMLAFTIRDEKIEALSVEALVTIKA